MRVTACVPAYPPRSRVGAWLSTHEFLAQLARRGHDVTVVPIDGDDRYVLDGVSVVPAIESISPHIAHADIVISHAGDHGAAQREARRRGIPSVRFAHGHIADPATLEGAALVIFNSTALAASIDCPSPSVVCHPATTPHRYRTTPGQRVTLINLSEQKGGELFWRLVRCATHREFLGVIGGYGNQYIDVAPNAEVIPTTDNMRDDVYARTRILLMPSERETWGMAGVEAMASGIPVIAHPTPGLVESLGHAGTFVDRADGQGWLDEIERLHDPIEWQTASHLALARSVELDPTEDLNRFATAVEQLHCTGGTT